MKYLHCGQICLQAGSVDETNLQPGVRVSSSSENSPQSSTSQAGHTEVTPRLDPVSSASPLKSHPDPPIRDGNAKVLNNHADLDTNTTSSTNREADEPKPEPRPRSSTRNEQLSKSHLNITGTGSSEAQTAEMTVASPNIQSEDATAAAASSGTHTETKTGTVSSIPASGFTTESVASTVDPLPEKVETGKIRQQALSSVVTSPVPVVAIPSFKDFRTTEEDVSVERAATVVTPTLQSGEALSPRVTETEMSNVSASEEIEKEAMEDTFETVSPTGKTVPFQGGDGVNGTETDENETDPEVEEGHADGDRFYSHPSPDLISQFSTVGFSIQSETEPPQQTDRAANPPPTNTVRRQTPGIRGQRVGICSCFAVTMYE